MSFTKEGPFAYDGVIALWRPFVVFFAWMVVMTVAVLKAIDLEEQRQQTGSGVGPVPATNRASASTCDGDPLSRIEFLSNEIAAPKRQLEVAGSRDG